MAPKNAMILTKTILIVVSLLAREQIVKMVSFGIKTVEKNSVMIMIMILLMNASKTAR